MKRYSAFTALQIPELGVHMGPFSGLNQNHFKAYFQLFLPYPWGRGLVFSQPNNEKTNGWLRNNFVHQTHSFTVYSVTGAENSALLILSANKPPFIKETLVLCQRVMMVWDEYLKS